jgi:hypothetical protein
MSDGRLTVELAPRDLPSDGVFATEVISTGVPHSLTMSMSPGTLRTVSVPAGIYLVRVSLPSGELLSGTVEVAADADATVTVTATRAAAARATKGSGEPPVHVWVRLWRGVVPAGWPAEARNVPTRDGRRTVRLETGPGLHALQLGGRDVAWRVVCLPPADSCRVTLDRVRQVEDFEEGVRVRAWGSDARAGAMLRYLVAGQLDQARALAGDVYEEAAPSRQQHQSLEVATVAGYVLLKSRGNEGLRDWANTVADRYDWLPDGHVIQAWQLLRESGASRRNLARERLLDAVDAGVPRYTEGLRLLFEGLRLVGVSDPADVAVRSAVSEVRRYAESCDWAAPQTTYWGTGPTEPSLARRVGLPDDWSDVAEFWVGS